MDGMFKVTEEHQMLRDLVKKFVRNELMPLEKNILERFAAGQPAALSDEENKKLFKQCKDLGLWALDVPEEAGGANLPAVALGLVHAVTMARSGAHPAESIRVLDVLDRLQVLYLSVCFVGGLATHLRALAEVRSITARRQLRWIAWGTGLGVTPFAVGYALPYAFGSDTTLPMQLSALPLGVIPLAYASAIVRYRLLDIEVIVKRALVYAAAVAAILTIYALLFQTAQRLWVPDDTQHNWTIALLATLVALLLAPPVKGAIQTALDRAFYRDRYDYKIGRAHV